MEPPALKDELKFATTMLGALSVIPHGLLTMLLWPADNLDSVALVSCFFSITCILSFPLKLGTQHPSVQLACYQL